MNFWEIGLGTDQLKRDSEKAKAMLNGIGKTAEDNATSMDSAFNKAFAFAGGATAIGLLGKQILDTTAKFEKFGVVLKNTLGEKAGNNALDMISQFAATTPFQLDEVTSSFIKLTNQGFTPTRDELIKLGDLASSTGKSFDQLAEAVLDAQTGEFERLKEFGIKAKQSGDQVTFTFKDQKTTVDKTNASIKDYILSLGELKGIQGSNALISQRLTGQISNLEDKLAAMYNTIGTSNKGVLYSAVGGVSALVENYETVGKVLIGLVATYGAYKAAIIVATATSKGYTLAMQAQYVTLLITEKAQMLLNKSMLANPYVLVTTAVIGLVSAFLIYKSTQEDVIKNNNYISKAESEITTKYKDEEAKIRALSETIKDNSLSISQRKKALSELQKIVPDYHASLASEGKLINDNKVAIDDYLKSVEKKIKYDAYSEQIVSLTKQKIYQEGYLKIQAKGLGLKKLELGKGEVPLTVDEILKNPQIKSDSYKETVSELTKLKQLIDGLNESVVTPTPTTTAGSGDVKTVIDYKKNQLEAIKTADKELIDYQRSLIEDKRLLLEFDLKQTLKAIDDEEAALKKATPKGQTFNSKPFELRREVATNVMLSGNDAIDAEEMKAKADAILEIAKKYQEERKQIETEANAEIEKLRKSGFEMEAKSAEFHRDNKISTLTAGLIQETDAYKLATGEQLLISKETTARLIADIKKRIQEAQNDPDLSKRISKTDGDGMLAKLDKAENTVNKTDNPFADLTKALEIYKKAREAASNSNADIDIANFAKLEDAANKAQKSSLEAVAGALQGIGSIISTVTEEIKGLTESEKETVDEVLSIIQGAATLAQGIATGNPVAIIQGSIQLLINLYKALDTTAKNREALLETEKAKVVELETAYNNLSDAISMAYGQEKSKLITDQIAILEAQKKSLEAQKELELSKDKNKPTIKWWEGLIPGYGLYKLSTILLSPTTDPKAVEKYNSDIEAITKRQAELVRLSLVEAITGTTVMSAIDEFANAYADAFTSGEDAALKSADIVRNILLNALGQKLRDELQPEIEELMTMVANAMLDGSDGGSTLTYAEKVAIAAKKKAIDDLAAKDQQAYKDLGLGTSETRQATTKGFAQASQDSISELNGRFTAMTMITSKIAESMNDLKGNSSQSLKHLAGIESNTARLQAIESGIMSIKSAVESVNLNGVKLK